MVKMTIKTAARIFAMPLHIGFIAILLFFTYLFKRLAHKMAKHTQTIGRLKPTNYLSVIEHFVRLVLKGLKITSAK